MRVITGAAKGRRLDTPQGLETRPTPEMVKEAVFSIIQFEVEGSAVLDLFAGSGQMGIEALSRGARSCVFVDHSRVCGRVIEKNLKHTGLSGAGRLVPMDALSYLKSAKGPFDIAFADPPYAQAGFGKLLPRLSELMSESGCIICESGRDEVLPERAGVFLKHREYRYGVTKITVYRYDTEEKNGESSLPGEL